VVKVVEADTDDLPRPKRRGELGADQLAQPDARVDSEWVEILALDENGDVDTVSAACGSELQRTAPLAITAISDSTIPPRAA
jgi:hypothetical protein